MRGQAVTWRILEDLADCSAVHFGRYREKYRSTKSGNQNKPQHNQLHAAVDQAASHLGSTVSRINLGVAIH
jgi:hypothetical protein